MRPSDHFFTELSSLQRQRDSGKTTDGILIEEARGGFARLIAPIVGEEVAEEVFEAWKDRYASGITFNLEALGWFSAFFLGDYDNATMSLTGEDWAAIRDAISAEAENLDIETLNALMSDLLDRGAL